MLRKMLPFTLVPRVLIGIIAVIVLTYVPPKPPEPFTPEMGGSKFKPIVSQELDRVHASAEMIDFARSSEPIGTQEELAKRIEKAGLQKSWVIEMYRMTFADGTKGNSSSIVYPGRLGYRLVLDERLMSAMRESKGSSGNPEVIPLSDELRAMTPQKALERLNGDE